MKSRTKVEITASIALILLGCCVAATWRSVQREQAELRQKLDAAEAWIRDASARQKDRKMELDAALGTLAAQKKAVQTPKQAIEALPSILPLPKPVGFEYDAPSSEAAAKSAEPPEAAIATESNRRQADSAAPKLSFPAEDIKPLYDFAVDCKACQVQLAAVQADLKDERTKTDALSRERDSALQAARGGSAIKRIMRAAKWFVIGAAVGAAAAKLAH